MEKHLLMRLNSGELLVIHLFKDILKESYSIEVTNSNNKIIASSFFCVDSGVCFLYRIEICNPEYSHKGIGTKLLNIMEDFAKQKICRRVEGRFFPFGEFGDFAKDLYLKNGYKIYKDGYETYLYKNLSKTNEKTL